MSRLLVVDWDFFFPMPQITEDAQWQLYDWGHQESMFFITVAWQQRASAFLANDLPLPQPAGWEDFWERFTYNDEEGVPLYFAESNSAAISTDGPWEEGTTEVWLYDAHHDAGYSRKEDSTMEKLRQATALIQDGKYSCEDWMICYWRDEANLHVRYPTWREDAFEAEPEPWIPLDRQFDSPDNGPQGPIDRIFVCRSGAWVPSWCDEAFHTFLSFSPDAVGEQTEVGGMSIEPREFDLGGAQEEADRLKDVFKWGLKS